MDYPDYCKLDYGLISVILRRYRAWYRMYRSTRLWDCTVMYMVHPTCDIHQEQGRSDVRGQLIRLDRGLSSAPDCGWPVRMPHVSELMCAAECRSRVGESAAHRRLRAAVRTGAGRIILVGSIIQVSSELAAWIMDYPDLIRFWINPDFGLCIPGPDEGPGHNIRRFRRRHRHALVVCRDRFVPRAEPPPRRPWRPSNLVV